MEIKYCPFCGRIPIATLSKPFTYEVYCVCGVRGTAYYSKDIDKGIKKAIEAWNKRV